jgi:hypothetical protein
LAKAEALNFSQQVQKFRHRFAAESAVEKRATISKGGLMVRLLARVVPVFIVASVLTFPLTVYEGYFREHKYGLLNQTFGPWNLNPS